MIKYTKKNRKGTSPSEIYNCIVNSGEDVGLWFIALNHVRAEYEKFGSLTEFESKHGESGKKEVIAHLNLLLEGGKSVYNLVEKTTYL